MSRAKRREGRGSARSRRTPVAAAGRGPRIPWVPLVMVIVVAAVAGLVVFLIIQAGQEASGGSGEAAQIEADPAEDLAGEFVDLQTIYGGTYGNPDGPDTSGHVRRDVDYIEDGNTNPPAGGPHWGASACTDDPDTSPPFCGPAPWGIFRTPWEPETLVHNMEHAGIILWYNTTDQAIIDELEEIIGDGLSRDELLVMTPYPDMEEEHIALTSWARIDKLPVSEYSKERVEQYLDDHKCRFNPEGVPGAGC